MPRRQQPSGHDASTAVVGEPVTTDVLVVGAGLAGINMAYRLQTNMPHLRFTVLEARDDIGGTWDVFKYPGVRSDSDMYTFGFEWHPWQHKILGEGGEIMSYMRECVAKFDLDKTICLGHKVVKADWSSGEKKWAVQVVHNKQVKMYTAKWLVLSPGYYNYDKPFPAVVPGIDTFQGQVLHPQFWPPNFDCTDKRFAIIGSGATAVTLLPALVRNGAKEVTMVQRSPSYVASLPNPENTPSLLTRYVPLTTLHWLRRWSWHYTMWLIHFMCTYFPAKVRDTIASDTRKQLPSKVPFDPHFVPAYMPWEQRLCFANNGDFFRVLHTDQADVVTGTIKTVTAKGVAFNSGSTSDFVEADVIVTATGLTMHFAGGIPISVDREPVTWPDKLLWNGCMVQDVPNMFFMWGYTNNSWTLGADATATIACRLLKHMEKQNLHVAVPQTQHQTTTQSFMKLSSTYISAAQPFLPKCGSEGPWKPRRIPIVDMVHAQWGNITKDLHFL